MSNLVNEPEKPTLWSEGEGRWKGAGITEVALIDGSRVGISLTPFILAAFRMYASRLSGTRICKL